MSYSSVNKFVRVSRATDGSQIAKNEAQAQAALINAAARQKKMRLEEISASDKHEMHNLKAARESIKLEQEAKAYWDSLSVEEKAALSAEIEKEKEVQLEAFKNKAENVTAAERLELKRRSRKNKAEALGDKMSSAFKLMITIIGVSFLAMIAIIMIQSFFKAMF